MFFLCCSLRNLLPPLTVFDLHKVFWIHASLRHIRDGPCIYAATRSTQHFSPFVQPDLATLEGCLLQRERNTLEYRNVVLEKHSSPTDSRPVWIPSQPSNQEDWQSIQQTWRRLRRTLLLW